MPIATVFGGSGFLGSHVADKLMDAGYRVRLYDRTDSPWRTPKQEMIVGDVLDEKLVSEAVAGADVVYNFAAIADLNEARLRPVDTVTANVLGNAHVLEACRTHATRRVVYASTVYVYSREGGFYRCSKQAAEQYVEEYQRTYGLDYTILRFGSLYGPRADHTNGLRRIVTEALATGVVRYDGSPEAMREYLHVEDAARAAVSALQDEFRNQSVVVTGQQLMRVRDLLEMLAEIMGIPTKVEFNDREYPGHYVRTPYAYHTVVGRKFVLPLHVDLGQGLLQLIHDVQSRSDVE